jgi:hypothetical protein
MSGAARVYCLDKNLASFVETLRLVVSQAAEAIEEGRGGGSGGGGGGGGGLDDDYDYDAEAAMAEEEQKADTDSQGHGTDGELGDEYFMVEEHHHSP